MPDRYGTILFPEQMIAPRYQAKIRWLTAFCRALDIAAPVDDALP
jgi:hypothetical protein